jgi:tryptophanyl-tRNA synthetase
MTFGFLGYPVSQAADITAFSANLVPVGEDQLPQIEQTQEIVQKFNRIYGKVLTKPEAKVGEVARVKGLDGSAKMSKSLNNAIYLADDEETITKKVMKAKTDPEKIKLNDPGHPEVCTVFEYAKMFGLKELAKIEKDCRAGKIGCVHCKQLLIKKITEFLKPIRKKRLYYENNPDLVEKILKEGNKKAREVAKETMKKVKKAMHLDYF